MPYNIWNVLHIFATLRGIIGTIPTLIAFGLYLNVKDPRLVDLSRAYLSTLLTESKAPDWVRALANGNGPDVVDAARADMMANPEFEQLRLEEEEDGRSD